MSDPFRLFEFEISGDASESDAGGDYGGDVGGDEGGYEGEETYAEAEPQYLTADDIQPLLQYQQATMPVFQQLQEALSAEEEELFGDAAMQEGQQPQQPEYDPFNPAHTQALAQHVANQQVEAALAPFQGLLGMMATEKGEQLANDALDEIEEAIGEFDHDTTFLIANSMLNDPSNTQDPATTLATVAQWVQQREQEIGEAAIEAYKAELQGLAGAQREAPAGGGSATPVEGIPNQRGADKYRAVVQNFQSRQSPSRIVG